VSFQDRRGRKKFQATDAKLSPDAGTQRCSSKSVLRLAKIRGLLFSGGSWPREFSLLHFSAGRRVRIFQGCRMSKGARKANGGFELSEAPSHLIRRCQQFYGDLYARESGTRELTKQQYTLLAALEHNDGASQTVLVEITGIDRSTLAEMVRRMLEKGLLSRERTEEDQRANAVAISPAGKKALRSARNASDRAEKALLETLPMPDRQKFIRALAQIAEAGESFAANGNSARAHKVSGRAKRL
jgi:DNA-binding MarR family transcriptional regulator